MRNIDCRGLACPAPVMETKKLVDQPGTNEVEVLVDNLAAAENVSRFLKHSGFSASIKKQGTELTVTGRREGEAADPEVKPAPIACDRSTAKVLVFIPTDRIGVGDDELGKKLMASFIKTLPEMGPDLWRIILVNNGVKMAVRDAAVLPDLVELEKSGVSILVCGTCLIHFGLLDAKEVGETTNMLDVVTSLHLADKVISV